MKLYKIKDRKINGKDIRKGFRDMGYKVIDLGEYSKWKEVSEGRLQVTLTVYKLSGEVSAYLVCDSLDRVACPLVRDSKEVLDYLKEHSWKTTKKWYLEDYGMTEETWNIWNGISENEE